MTTKADAREKAAKRASDRRPTLRILNMEHESLWLEKRKLPRFLFPFEYSMDPCSACIGECCSADVYVTVVEALRIALTLSLPLDAVVERRPADGPKGRAQSLPIPLGEGEVRLRLRHRDETHACVFLHKVAGRGMCAVHGLRPGVCRLYPFRVDLGGRVLSAGEPITCPTRWLYNEETETSLQRDVEGWLADLEEEKRLLRAWKRSRGEDRSFAGFTAFAIRRLAKRFGKDAEEVLAPPRRRLGERRAPR